MNAFLLLAIVFSFLGFCRSEHNGTPGGNPAQKHQVISNAQELITKIDAEPVKSQYVTYIYHSSICSYCTKVTDSIKGNQHVEIIDFHEDSNLEELVQTEKPIVVLMKNINKGSSIDRSIFFAELNEKGGKIQVPALEIHDFIMYESDEIIKFYKHLIEKVGGGEGDSEESQEE
ncbi:hypothetical protein PVIIG_01624 [Plasmodium vivax India VII]|uniref:Thioredoxin-like protein n=5 Tax=Plasmodium vivax TaxID=5855 RepID=A5K8F4_PLAVS|nr:hypothetical protein, conserved [Plasmodium vivax]KMZ79150.1 hypothetical protein PVIIG_01624 [Plasmodium vivax India VII]KMZ85296.1 hypothetical protein PVBG_01982 [Plasmodium vivax Brazil I]KMZ91172.1 hypothetical protein PVMG_00046 [Plasmodium vivax Mauritania I]KMZ98439.1 hypothetical protein PVNG_04383 [Plasmodium vivax North Korean]EDL44568.1 hypothetical protein, conserved [Plasmodium vivax]|eukprot:XP_001614295.1 hypothetical protein [Plasmodium vivax Sal-1]